MAVPRMSPPPFTAPARRLRIAIPAAAATSAPSASPIYGILSPAPSSNASPPATIRRPSRIPAWAPGQTASAASSSTTSTQVAATTIASSAIPSGPRSQPSDAAVAAEASGAEASSPAAAARPSPWPSAITTSIGAESYGHCRRAIVRASLVAACRYEHVDRGALVAEVDAVHLAQVLPVDLDRGRHVAGHHEIVEVVEIADPPRPVPGVARPQEPVDGEAPHVPPAQLPREDDVQAVLEVGPRRHLHRHPAEERVRVLVRHRHVGGPMDAATACPDRHPLVQCEALLAQDAERRLHHLQVAGPVALDPLLSEPVDGRGRLG